MDREYQVKAVFLEQFTRFVEWPESSAVADTTLPFVLGVIGDNPFGALLESVYEQRRIKKKPVELRYITDLDEIPQCHLLFIAGSAADRLPEILARTADLPILTVADSEGFAQRSVLINLYLSGETVKFEINEKAVRSSGLAFSYLLLNLARVVNPVR